MIELFTPPDNASVVLWSSVIARLVLAIGPETYSALFGNPSETLSRLDNWIRSDRSELSGRGATLGLQDGDAVGVSIVVPGPEILSRRRWDMLSLLKNADPTHRVVLKEFFSGSLGVLPPVGEDEFYVRALSVDPKYRGQGIGKRLLQKALQDGNAAGFKRVRIDVDASNLTAISLYQSFGFRTTYRGNAPPLGILTYSMLLELNNG